MNCRLGFLFLISISVITAVVLTRAGSVYARTEQVLDASNNNLMISMEVPDDWNSGKLSMTVLNINWKLNGLFATNFATKLSVPTMSLSHSLQLSTLLLLPTPRFLLLKSWD